MYHKAILYFPSSIPQKNVQNKLSLEGHGVRVFVFVASLSYRRNIGLWCELGMEMQVGDLERAMPQALRALAASEDVLVHCKMGKHRSSAFLCFLLCLFQ